jgi:hypothetical protein
MLGLLLFQPFDARLAHGVDDEGVFAGAPEVGGCVEAVVEAVKVVVPVVVEGALVALAAAVAVAAPSSFFAEAARTLFRMLEVHRP